MKSSRVCWRPGPEITRVCAQAPHAELASPLPPRFRRRLALCLHQLLPPISRPLWERRLAACGPSVAIVRACAIRRPAVSPSVPGHRGRRRRCVGADLPRRRARFGQRARRRTPRIALCAAAPAIPHPLSGRPDLLGLPVVRSSRPRQPLSRGTSLTRHRLAATGTSSCSRRDSWPYSTRPSAPR